MTVDSSPRTPPSAADDDLASELLSAHRRLLDSIGEKTPLSGLLQQFCATLDEAIAPVCSCVMLYQPVERILNVGAAPGLPAELRRALDGLTAGLAPGSCSAAVHRNEVVVSRDLATDPLWSGLREVALAAGFRACWSLPIRSLQWADSPGKDDEVRVVGTVALYLRRAALADRAGDQAARHHQRPGRPGDQLRPHPGEGRRASALRRPHRAAEPQPVLRSAQGGARRSQPAREQDGAAASRSRSLQGGQRDVWLRGRRLPAAQRRRATGRRCAGAPICWPVSATTSSST